MIYESSENICFCQQLWRGKIPVTDMDGKNISCKHFMEHPFNLKGGGAMGFFGDNFFFRFAARKNFFFRDNYKNNIF